MFNPGHALLLRRRRILAPRNNPGLPRQQTRAVPNGQTIPGTFHSRGISTFLSRTRFGRSHRLFPSTIVPRSFHFRGSSTPTNFAQIQFFHRRSAGLDFPLPRFGRRQGLVTPWLRPINRHAISRPAPFHSPNCCHTLTQRFHCMSTFDPNFIRKVVSEFTPKRPPKFQELLAAKELITELRRKGASYESIADLLTQHCQPASKSAIAMFCHEVLGEPVRSCRRPVRRRMPASSSSKVENKSSPTTRTISGVNRPIPATNTNKVESPAPDSCGPHIAKVELLPPGEKYD